MINKAILMGRLVADPELKQTSETQLRWLNVNTYSGYVKTITAVTARNQNRKNKATYHWMVRVLSG